MPRNFNDVVESFNASQYTVLDLSDVKLNQMSNELRQLFLKNSQTLQVIILQKNSLTTEFLQDFFQVLQQSANIQLKYLQLSSNALHSGNYDALINGLHNLPIKQYPQYLDLSNNKFTQVDVNQFRKLITEIQNKISWDDNKLKYIDLCENGDENSKSNSLNAEQQAMISSQHMPNSVTINLNNETPIIANFLQENEALKEKYEAAQKVLVAKREREEKLNEILNSIVLKLTNIGNDEGFLKELEQLIGHAKEMDEFFFHDKLNCGRIVDVIKKADSLNENIQNANRNSAFQLIFNEIPFDFLIELAKEHQNINIRFNSFQLIKCIDKAISNESIDLLSFALNKADEKEIAPVLMSFYEGSNISLLDNLIIFLAKVANYNANVQLTVSPNVIIIINTLLIRKCIQNFSQNSRSQINESSALRLATSTVNRKELSKNLVKSQNQVANFPVDTKGFSSAYRAIAEIIVASWKTSYGWKIQLDFTEIVIENSYEFSDLNTNNLLFVIFKGMITQTSNYSSRELIERFCIIKDEFPLFFKDEESFNQLWWLHSASGCNESMLMTILSNFEPSIISKNLDSYLIDGLIRHFGSSQEKIDSIKPLFISFLQDCIENNDKNKAVFILNKIPLKSPMYRALLDFILPQNFLVDEYIFESTRC